MATPSTNTNINVKVSTYTLPVATGFKEQYFYPEDYGAKGDAKGLLNVSIATDCRTVSDTQYKFRQEDVGKRCYWFAGWQRNSPEAYIASVSPDGSAYLDRSIIGFGPTGSSVYRTTFTWGTDDTQAIEDCLVAASKAMLDVQQLGQGADPTSWGCPPVSGIVKLSAGRAYLVKNTQERYDAGKIAAIMIPRHGRLQGGGMAQTHIFIAPGSVGHGIANWGAGAASLAGDERITLSDFSLFCNRANQTASCGNGIHYATSMGNYTSVDSFSTFQNIAVHQSRGHGFYFKGRGENLYSNLWSMNSEFAGFYMDETQDCRWHACNAGGSGWAGFYIYGAASSAFSMCKSYYNGSGGENYPERCCNWFISNANHSYRKGNCLFTNCEAQESRGSSWYLTGGMNLLSGCLASDPKRGALGGGTMPPVAAALHLAADATNNVFDGFYCKPALGIDWSNENHYGGDYAVYIERNAFADGNVRAGPRNNRGNIYTLTPSVYTVSKLGGAGITNRMNTALYVDGDPLPSDVPSAPTINSVVFGEDGSAVVTHTPATILYGRPVTDYRVEYKLTSDNTWTTFNRTKSDVATTNVTGLTIGQTYDFRVASINLNGTGAYSSTFSGYLNTPALPGQVTGLRTIAGSGQMYLNWTVPLTGGAAITDYKIEYKTNASGTWLTWAHTASSVTNITITGLVNDTLYNFRVSAMNSVGYGPVSATGNATPIAILSTYFDSTMLAYFDANITTSVVSSNGTAIESWTDSSGLGMTLTQTTAADKPSKGTKTINSVPVIQFDGITDYLTSSSSSALYNSLPVGDCTIIFVAQLNTGGTSKTNSLIQDSNGYFQVQMRSVVGDVYARIGGTTGANVAWTPDTNAHIIVVRRSSNSLKVYVDGGNGSASVTASDITTPSAFSIGRVSSSSSQLDGQIGVFIPYDAALSFSSINTKCAALAARYGTTWTNISS